MNGFILKAKVEKKY